MNRKQIFFVALLLVCCVIILNDSQAAATKRNDIAKNKSQKNEQTIQSQIGLNIPEWGIAIDAVYNPELSSIIPGYHILNIVLTNSRAETIYFSTKRDKWVVVDNTGKRHTAFNHVKQFNEGLWPKLPEKLQDLLAYPAAVSSGRASNIDVFLPRSVDLFNFREIVWKSDYFKKEFNIMTNYERSLQVPDNIKEFDIPKQTKSAEESMTLEGETPALEQTVTYPSKYLPPQIGDVKDTHKPDDDKYPPFDPSFDDTIIIRE
ncbi:MAG: hypothetical protein HQM16_09315 [Deltaproteobacteria bacterium]|nr:hypothetical protein [Deltaproteobacteria bacterium]